MCKKAGLNLEEMELMTIGMCLDYLDEYIESSNPKSNKTIRKANQADYDRF